LTETLARNIWKAIYIAEKDAKIYFFKWLNITFGLLFPDIVYFVFAVGRTAEASQGENLND